MFKMSALFKQPKDKEKFDEYYFNTHAPLTEKIPGLRKMTVTKIVGSPMGESEFYMQCDMYYDDFEAFKVASKTPEAKASGKDVMSFAGDIVTFMFGEEINE
jgi:uncharacterized protein (TIGR02118 family)